MKLRPWSLLLGIAVVAGACDSTTLLSGNFDQKPYPRLAGEIPGDPAGDRIQLFEVLAPTGTYQPGGVAANRFYFRDTACDLDELCFGIARSALFHPRAMTTSEAARDWTLQWFGIPGVEPGASLDVSLMISHSKRLLGIRFDGQGATVKVTALTGTGETVIGSVPQREPHLMLIGISRATGTFGINLTADGSANSLVSERLPLATTGIGVVPLSLVFTYTNPRASNSTLALDTLSLTVAGTD